MFYMICRKYTKEKYTVSVMSYHEKMLKTEGGDLSDNTMKSFDYLHNIRLSIGNFCCFVAPLFMLLIYGYIVSEHYKHKEDIYQGFWWLVGIFAVQTVISMIIQFVNDKKHRFWQFFHELAGVLMVVIVPVSVMTICIIAWKGDAQPTDHTILCFMIVNSFTSMIYIT